VFRRLRAYGCLLDPLLSFFFRYFSPHVPQSDRKCHHGVVLSPHVEPVEAAAKSPRVYRAFIFVPGGPGASLGSQLKYVAEI
jgi:hypothetical protein